MGSVTRADLIVRRADLADDDEVLALLRESLGKEGHEHYESFFRWKHRENPFGQSPAWVAVHDGAIVGYRTFLRWEFVTSEGKRRSAVRAVDTATAPGYRGVGIFRTLTIQGVAELTLAGDGIVFNTPNDQSRPGYLTMGWSVARRVPVGVLPGGVGGLARTVRARVPSDLWSQPCDVGLEASEALADVGTAEALLTHAPASGFRTNRTADYLAWRYSLGALRYRLLLADPGEPSGGGVVFRLRRRGDAVEAAIVEMLVPDAWTGARLVRRVLRESGADYAIGVRSGRARVLPPLPRQGPILTTRALASSPPEPDAWALTLGDVELF